MTERGLTPSQTIGPYFAYSLTPTRYHISALVGDDLVTEDAVGEPIRIEGRVFDGTGAGVTDALVEIWQADGEGRFAGHEGGLPSNAAFKGFGRSECDGEGRYGFRTVKPGPVPGPNGTTQAPHILVSIFARGVLNRLHTRIYLEGEAGNETDPILALVPAERRGTLIARRAGETDGMKRYVLDIHLQGEDETVFFEA